MSKQEIEGWKRATVTQVKAFGSLFFSEVCFLLQIPEATENEFFDKAFKPLIDEGKIAPGAEEFPVPEGLHPICNRLYAISKAIAPEAPAVEHKETLE